jgi:dTDP-D-glucose 4,6-dehydratase
MKKALVCGAGEFIGGHLVKKLKKEVKPTHLCGLPSVCFRNSENSLIKEKLNRVPNYPLFKGMEKTYAWILEQVKNNK